MDKNEIPPVKDPATSNIDSTVDFDPSVHQDIDFPGSATEVEPIQLSSEQIKRPSVVEKLRSRSHPVRKSTFLKHEPLVEVEPTYEVKPTEKERKKEGSNKPLQATASRSLETVLGNQNKKEPLITRHMLFKEALYTSIHMLGRPTNRFPSNQEDLSVYSLVTFSSDEKEQVAVVEHVRGEAFPLTVVNTMVKRGERLAGRSQGLADTYCFVGLETMDSLDRKDWKTLNIGSPLRPKRSTYPTKDRVRPLAEKRLSQVYTRLPSYVRTTVQLQTANPIWEQRFQCITLRPSIDTLAVEVWDHDDEQSVLRAIKNAKDAKKAHEVAEGMEELEESFYLGKRDDFLGKVTVKVQDIPVDGQERWYNLTGRTHRGEDATGRLLLQIWLTHAYRHGRHFEDYAEPKVILTRFWDYILKVESEKHGENWSGDIPVAATCLLFQYGLQTGISEASQAIIRWNAYAKHNLGLYGVGPRLLELDQVLTRIYQEESVHQRNSELETSMVVLCIERLCPVIRNHLRETQERVQEALKSIKHCRSILKRYKSDAAIERIDWLVHASLKMSILEWYDAKYEEVVHSQHLKNQHELVGGVALVMKKVNGILGDGQTKWKTLFWMEGSVDYMPIVFHEFQKMVIHDVETLAWSILEHYGNNDKLRRTLLAWYPTSAAYSNGWAVCEALFKLFIETQIFVMTQDDIFEDVLEPYTELNEYHLWFRPVLVMWLGYTFIKSCEMTTKAIQLDDVTPDTYVKISSSAIDTAVIFQQLASFWKELNWPDVAESYVVLHFLIDMMCRIALLYTHLHKKKLSAQGYFDTEDRFDISDRLCTAFNNIEYVKDEVMKIPAQLKVEKLLINLEKNLGEATGKEYKNNLEASLIRTGHLVEKLFKEILSSVGDRVRPEIRNALEGSFTMLLKGEEVESTLEPLLSYLEDNLVVLDKSLLEYNFTRFLQMFWNTICEEIVSVSKNFPLESTKEQNHFFSNLSLIFPPVMDYFKGGLTDEELNCSQYHTAHKFLTLLILDTESLIDHYYGEKATEHMNGGRPEYGTLTVHINYWTGKLNVHVIKANNLLPMDNTGFQIFKRKPNSDPLVEIEILPETNFHEPLAQKTETKWKTLNPEFDEKFIWNVTQTECQRPNATIRFTVKDFDILSKNDFLGEAFVPLAHIPGIPEHGAIPQPMTLHLRTVNPDHLILLALKSRHWDSRAQEFVQRQSERTIDLSDLTKPNN